jgi:hypothetical protein
MRCASSIQSPEATLEGAAGAVGLGDDRGSSFAGGLRVGTTTTLPSLDVARCVDFGGRAAPSAALRNANAIGTRVETGGGLSYRLFLMSPIRKASPAHDRPMVRAYAGFAARTTGSYPQLPRAGPAKLSLHLSVGKPTPAPFDPVRRLDAPLDRPKGLPLSKERRIHAVFLASR